jgi:DNA-binding MarR family transcriptional regulator
VPSNAPPAPSPAASAFAEAWDEFFGAIRRARGRAARDSHEGSLTLAQYQLITAFAEHDEMTVGELALAGGVAPPTATRMLTTLEREGIAERHACDEDRRRVNVRLTPKGRKVLAAKRALIAEKQEMIFSMLSPAEREQAQHILRRLAGAVEEL